MQRRPKLVARILESQKGRIFFLSRMYISNAFFVLQKGKNNDDVNNDNTIVYDGIQYNKLVISFIAFNFASFGRLFFEQYEKALYIKANGSPATAMQNAGIKKLSTK